jgi:hypothetical protein
MEPFTEVGNWWLPDAPEQKVEARSASSVGVTAFGCA